jgi:hypothetical protein
MENTEELTDYSQSSVKLFGAVRNISPYRWIVAAGFIICILLALLFPTHMSDPDDWAYYFAVKNFSQFHFTVDSATHSQQVFQAQQMRGSLIQYVSIGNDKWAFEKAPGYVLYLVPFELLNIPRWGNVLLALGMILVTYILLKRMRDEKTAMIGCVLLLFTPVAMIMLNRCYMDTYASLAFLVMGGGLYIYYILESEGLKSKTAWIVLFLSFFLIGWSVITRYTNFPIVAVFALHFMVTRIILFRKRQSMKVLKELLPAALGIGISMAVILLYDYLIFGSPFDYGYHYTRFPINFAYQYLGRVNQTGQLLPLQIILNNLRAAPRSLLLGFPLLVFGIPGIITILVFKFVKCSGSGRWSSLTREMPWSILLILIGWFIFVFGLYIMYEWTADFRGGGPFIMFDRFYLPGLFPVVVVCALIIARFPFKLYIPAVVLLVAAAVIFYLQWTGLNILPGILGTMGGGQFRGSPGFPSPGGNFFPGLPPGGSGNFPGGMPFNGFTPPAP